MHRLKVKPRAIIFDMDGVIIDSMPYHFLAWYEALRPYGVRVSCFDVYSKEGEKWEKTLKDLLGRAQIKYSARMLKEIFLKRQIIFKKNFKRFIFQGVEDFLICLKRQGYILGLVTGSPIEEVEKILPAKIRLLFNSIVAGNQVKRGKPHPEPYLKCAQSIGLKPRQCLVVENAPFGIESAKKAGMFCVALTTSLPREYLSKADIVADKLSDIFGFIENSCGV
ncbi:MAG: HAD family phosphatase [Candidatus Omnitrophica bacterium]|nr:HAD family phosphatase [Candidatus Omnitrophota bacterium]MDD3987449.1 HAD family phosphatase [Candidatus Omnitrophota bacterium]MDD4981250.1 HAD family phosphatase [Candidatus Omnitrophota bacterium]MDD5664664.1 HAD family phosphatase [Candidatus Omnitrophota bacterium]